MPYEPQNLRRWTYDGPTAFDSASNYAGPDLTHLWIGPVSQTRDSGPLDRSNFAVVSKELEKIGDDWDREHDWDGEGDPAVAIHRFGHWGPGWYEIILIRADCESALRRADEWVASLADYPVADEIHLSEIEFEETHGD